jgi:hypothetical protein
VQLKEVEEGEQTCLAYETEKSRYLNGLTRERPSQKTMTAASIVLRRSYGKSRSGCATCRSRRVKCDEAKPVWCLCPRSHACFDVELRPLRSQRCARSSRVCQYANREIASTDGRRQAIAWLQSVYCACQRWEENGQPPFPTLATPSPLEFQFLRARDRRYLWFIGESGNLLDRRGTTDFCLWWALYDLYAYSKFRYSMYLVSD